MVAGRPAYLNAVGGANRFAAGSELVEALQVVGTKQARRRAGAAITCQGDAAGQEAHARMLRVEKRARRRSQFLATVASDRSRFGRAYRAGTARNSSGSNSSSLRSISSRMIGCHDRLRSSVGT